MFPEGLEGGLDEEAVVLELRGARDEHDRPAGGRRPRRVAGRPPQAGADEDVDVIATTAAIDPARFSPQPNATGWSRTDIVVVE